MICPMCGYHIRGKSPNKRKHHLWGCFVHKICPGKMSYRKAARIKAKEEGQ